MTTSAGHDPTFRHWTTRDRSAHRRVFDCEKETVKAGSELRSMDERLARRNGGRARSRAQTKSRSLVALASRVSSSSCYVLEMRLLARSIPALLIFGFAAGCGGSASNESTDAGTSNDAGSSGDAQSTAHEDGGTEIDSGGVVKSGPNTLGIDMEPDIQQWSIESSLVLFTFTMIVDPSLKLASVDGANVWFDGDTPHAFGFGPDTDLGTSSTGYEWDGALTNNPEARLSLSLDTAANGGIAGSDARPYSPYEAGNLHVLLYGTLSTGDAWQASTTFSAQ